MTLKATTPTWARQVLEEHQDLRRKVGEMRDYLEAPRPALGEIGAHTWAAGLTRRLVTLHDELFRHFRFEDEGGMAEELSTRHPRATGQVERLVGEHPRILSDVRALMHDALTYSEGASVPDASLRRRVSDVLDRLAAHEAEETEMIQRLATDDLGSGD